MKTVELLRNLCANIRRYRRKIARLNRRLRNAERGWAESDERVKNLLLDLADLRRCLEEREVCPDCKRPRDARCPCGAYYR